MDFNVVLFVFRMRKYIKRGGVGSQVQYNELRAKIWDEIQCLVLEKQVIYDRDIQEIAMIQAMGLGLEEFKVNFKCLIAF